jgi:putative intracellular protease/amidase
MMSSNAPHKQPSHVTAEAGEVNVDGPDGVATSFTPDAAEETGRRLVDAASEARTQLPGQSA